MNSLTLDDASFVRSLSACHRRRAVQLVCLDRLSCGRAGGLSRPGSLQCTRGAMARPAGRVSGATIQSRQFSRLRRMHKHELSLAALILARCPRSASSASSRLGSVSWEGKQTIRHSPKLGWPASDHHIIIQPLAPSPSRSSSCAKLLLGAFFRWKLAGANCCWPQ